MSLKRNIENFQDKALPQMKSHVLETLIKGVED